MSILISPKQKAPNTTLPKDQACDEMVKVKTPVFNSMNGLYDICEQQMTRGLKST